MQQSNSRRRRFGWLTAAGVLGVLLALLLSISALRLSEGVTVTQNAQDASYDLPINIRSADAFTKTEQGYIAYPGAKMGIDVSAHQLEIDWQRVREAGVEFAILRAGFRGYGQGGLYEDEYFYANFAAAREAGVQLGVYFFSQALSVEEAEEEADFVLSMLNGTPLDYPIYFDWEQVGEEGSRTNGLESGLVGDCALAFCRRIAEAGYDAGVYFNQRYGYTIMQLEQLQDYSFWLAEYRDAPSFLYDFALWQYSGEGIIDGIETVVDLDLFFTDGTTEDTP